MSEVKNPDWRPDGVVQTHCFIIDGRSIKCTVKRVRGWRQRSEPKPQTAIYQNTPETDDISESGVVLDHNWSEEPASAYDCVGIYLGSGLVAVVECKE